VVILKSSVLKPFTRVPSGYIEVITSKAIIKVPIGYIEVITSKAVNKGV
jgi:hypothetical protein